LKQEKQVSQVRGEKKKGRNVEQFIEEDNRVLTNNAKVHPFSHLLLNIHIK
jgi:hypothetical protein